VLALGGCLSAAFADITYTVQRGDTASKVAARFSISLDDLIKHNNLKNPDLLYVGQVLRLPDKAAAPVEDAPTAKAGEPGAAGTPAGTTAAATPERPLTGRELQEERARLLEAQRAQRGEQIVQAATAYRGSPYRRGGLSSRGIDCSGLVVRAMAAQGMNVPHHAASLYRMGTRVTYEELQPGDLVFFNTNGKGVSHVGIWVGNHQFIHASSSGRGVVVDRMQGYYSRRLVGARRLH